MSPNNQAIQFKDNPYQYTRGIRFRANPEQQGELFKTKSALNDCEVNLSDLAGELLDIHKKLKELLFCNSYKREIEKQQSQGMKTSSPNTDACGTSKNNDLVFRRGLSINKTWLKTWHQDMFYLWIKNQKNKQGKYALKDLRELQESLKQWLGDWENFSSQIKKALESSQDSQIRRSDIAESIRGLLSRGQWDYINAFLMEAHTASANLDEKISKLKDSLKTVREKLKSAEQDYLPSQSSGIEIAKASFNYYTLNKKPKEDYNKNLQKIEGKVYKEAFSTIKKEDKKGHYTWRINDDKYQFKGEFFKSDQEKEWIKRYCDKNKDQFKGNGEQEFSLSLDQTYRAIKAFKAEQKSIFYDLMVHIASEKNNSYQVRNKNHILGPSQPGNSSHPSPLKEEASKGGTDHLKTDEYEGGYTLDYTKFDSFEELNKLFSLFSFTKKKDKNGINKTAENHYNDFKQLTKDIQKETDSTKQTEKAKKRGQYLFREDCYFPYGKFCETYKSIAQQRGRLLSQIKGIEREQREAAQTDFWSLIYCSPEGKQLWFVPKEKRKITKKFIYNEQGRKDYVAGDSPYLCCFESLTMRALHKLCFAEQSSFVEGLPEPLKQLQKSAKKFKTNGDEQELKEKDQKKLEFFKELLKSEYAKGILQLENFNLQCLDKAESLDTFEQSLETACYHIKKIVLEENEKQYFLKKFDVTTLDIRSYDLEGRNKNTYQTPASDNRWHTDLWQVFWSDVAQAQVQTKETKVKGFNLGAVRLNPEVKIRWRKADEDLKKYFDQKKFPSPFKHRRLQDQFTVHFTLAFNAGKKYEDIAFAKPEKLLDRINDFNQKLNREMNFKTAWKYGIDRGNIELATLCLVQFDPEKETYQENDKTIVQPLFPRDSGNIISCWTLRNYGHSEEYRTKKGEAKTRMAIKNLSYFMDEKYLNNENLFKKASISCLDLSTAKVIKGKIITNGDVMTYLKLKKAVAKRRLYELYHAGKIQRDELEWSEWEDGKKEDKDKRPEGVLNIQTSEGEKTIYWYRKEYENILINSQKNIKYDKQSIKNALNHYLNKLTQKDDHHTPTILQINHLRDAITANMVGVICHLQKSYPGFVILEDLGESDIKKHFLQSNENISRRLENALYNKFQSLGLVPPHVKDIICLREDIRKKQKEQNKKAKSEQNKTVKSSQIGAIVFVDESETSKTCPYCEEKQESDKLDKNEKSEFKKKKEDEKFRQQRFICGDSSPCGFDTYHFKPKEERMENYAPEINKASYKKEFDLFKDINDPDKVAAYNVAKKITNPSKIGKMDGQQQPDMVLNFKPDQPY